MYTFPDIVVVHGQVRIGMICLRGGGGYHVTDDTNSTLRLKLKKTYILLQMLKEIDLDSKLI